MLTVKRKLIARKPRNEPKGEMKVKIGDQINQNKRRKK